MESTWLTLAKRLQAIAATGQHYAEGAYDRERYEEIDGIARDMIGMLGNIPLEALSHLPIPAEGYATPKVDVRGAVVRNGEILLVQERSDDLWTLPGGFAEIGLSASSNVEKEIREEAGLRVSTSKLVSIRHRARTVAEPDYRDFYKLFFLCAPVDSAVPVAGHEVHEARFFDPGDLPAMSLGRSTPHDVERALAHWRTPDLATEWD